MLVISAGEKPEPTIPRRSLNRGLQLFGRYLYSPPPPPNPFRLFRAVPADPKSLGLHPPAAAGSGSVQLPLLGEGRGPLGGARRGFPEAAPGHHGPGQARRSGTHPLRFSFPGVGQRFFGHISNERLYGRLKKRERYTQPHGEQRFLCWEMVACVGNRINNEAGGLSVPFRHASPACEHPHRGRRATGLVRAGSCRAPSWGAAYRYPPPSLGSCVKKSNEIIFSSPDFLPKPSRLQRDSSQPRK